MREIREATRFLVKKLGIQLSGKIRFHKKAKVEFHLILLSRQSNTIKLMITLVE